MATSQILHARITSIIHGKFEVRLQTSRSYDRDCICIHWKQIIGLVKVDLTNAVLQFGASEFLLQTAGIPQGSPASVFLANLSASYIEYRSWIQAQSRISERLTQSFLHICRLRWVDDLFTIFMSESELTDFDISHIIDAEICLAYTPFGMKFENNRVRRATGFHQRTYKPPHNPRNSFVYKKQDI